MHNQTSDNRENRFSVAANVAQILQLLFQIAGYVLPLLTAGLLSLQPAPVQVPVINISLGWWYQTLLLICALLSYVQFLRNYWVKHKAYPGVSKDYRGFLVRDLIIKYPLLLAPLVLIYGPLVYILPMQESFLFIVASILSVIMCVVIVGYYNVDPISRLNRRWEEDPKLERRWFARIEPKLRKQSTVTTLDFEDCGNPDHEEIIFALKRYFIKYEFEQDLVFIPPRESDILGYMKPAVLSRRQNVRL